MVLTGAQITSFFEDADQMTIPRRTVAQLAVEGIASPEDLAEFRDDDFKQLLSNLRSPPAVPGVAPAGGGPAPLVPVQPFTLGAKSVRRLKVAAHASRYYDAISRPLTAGMMHYGNCLIHFELQWNALVKRGEEDEPAVPKITRNLRVTRWSESFMDTLHRINGLRDTPLAYVIRPDAAVAATAPALARNRPYSTEHGSVEGELVARLSHTNDVFRDDNAKVYQLLEEATRSTVYSSSLKPFQRQKNGRGAFLALMSQHAGIDKWESELKLQESFMKSRVWKGNSNFSLEKFVEQHRAAFISMQQCSQHVPCQLPDEYTRVRHLLDAIKSPDPELQAALAAIRADQNGPTAKRNNFEAAATFILPADPVAKRRRANKDGTDFTANVSSTAASSSSVKPSIGKTGVEFRYYTKKAYQQLTDPQKLELREWRLSQSSKRKSTSANSGGTGSGGPNDDGGAGPGNKKLRKTIASVLLEETKKKEEQVRQSQAQVNEIKDVLLDVLKPGSSSSAPAQASSTTATPDEKATAMATKLQNIIARSTGGKSG